MEEVHTSLSKVMVVSLLCVDHIRHEVFKGGLKHRRELLAVAEVFVRAFDTPVCLLMWCPNQGENMIHKL